MTLTVPSLPPGANSLPGQLRSGSNGQDRLTAGQRGDTVIDLEIPPGWRKHYAQLNAAQKARVQTWLAEHPHWPLPHDIPPGVAGLGDLVCPDYPDMSTCYDSGVTSTAPPPFDPNACLFGVDASGQCAAVSAAPPTIPGYSGPRTIAPGSPTPQAPSGYQWAQVLNASGQTIAQVLAISQGGSSIRLPNGQQLLFGSPQSSAYGALAAGAPGVAGALQGGTGPILLIGGLLVLLILAGGRR